MVKIQNTNHTTSSLQETHVNAQQYRKRELEKYKKISARLHKVLGNYKLGKLLARPIDTLKLTTRTLQALQDYGITTIGVLVENTDTALAGRTDIGAFGLAEIKENLDALGLDLE